MSRAENDQAAAIDAVKAKTLEAVKRDIEQGRIASLGEIAKALAPAAVGAVLPEDFEPTLPAAITKEQRAALERLRDVYGKVVLEARRDLTPAEVGNLLDERTTLDQIEKMCEGRKEDIKRIVHVAFDVRAEEAQLVTETTLRHETGFYILAGEMPAPEHDMQFCREPRSGSPSLTSEALRALAEKEDSGFTHEDFLACTRQTRVFDEHKAMLLLARKPELVDVIAKAIEPGTPTAAIAVRKIKGAAAKKSKR